MMTFARTLYALSDAVNAVVARLAGALIGLMLAVMLFQVAARYLFAAPPLWSEELARWLMVWGGLLGASVAFHTHADPAMVHAPRDHGMRQRLQAVARFVAAFGFFLPVIWFSWPYLLRQLNQPSDGMMISTAWMASALPVTSLVICLHALAGLGAFWSAEVRQRELDWQRHAHGAGEE